MAEFPKHLPSLNCEQKCPHSRECAQHGSAGDYRSEGGLTPILKRVPAGGFECSGIDHNEQNGCITEVKGKLYYWRHPLAGEGFEEKDMIPYMSHSERQEKHKSAMEQIIAKQKEIGGGEMAEIAIKFIIEEGLEIEFADFIKIKGF